MSDDAKARYEVICRELAALGLGEFPGIEIAQVVQRHEDAALAERDAWKADAERLAAELRDALMDVVVDQTFGSGWDIILAAHDRLVAGQTEHGH